MNEQYVKVPNNILTGKDLDYLSDMFEWNYGALKKTNEAINNADDEEIIGLLERGSAIFDSNLDSVLTILNEMGENNNG